MVFFEIVGEAMSIASLLILTLGIYVFIRVRKNGNTGLLGSYVIFLFLIEILSKIPVFFAEKANLIFFALSGFGSFVFLTLIYFKYCLDTKKHWRYIILTVGVLPLIIGVYANYKPDYFQSYDRAIYSLIIVLYSLFTIYKLTITNEIQKPLLLFNGFTLLFFSLDFLLAIGTNFLVNENLTLVSWFWTIRALFLQLFYTSLIYYIWKVGKNQ